MQKWLKNYENLRHSKEKETNELWISSKGYDTQNMPREELQKLWIPGLKMTYGATVSALTKSWTAYRIAGRNGEPRGDLAIRILNIQKNLGIPQSDGLYEELEQMGYTEEELNDEGTSEENENYRPGTGEEWSEGDQQLLKEEVEAEEDWWFS